MPRHAMAVALGALGLACACRTSSGPGSPWPPADAKYIEPFEPIEQVGIPVSDALELEGYLYRPRGPGRFPAVVLMHGCMGVGANYAPLNNVALLLRDAGYVALVVDSFTARNVVLALPVCSGAPPTVGERAEDALAASRFLSSLAFVDSSHMGLVGWSHGGTAAVLAWARNAAVPGTSRFAAVAAYYPSCFSQDVNSPSVPLLIIAGEEDDWCPAAPCRRLVETATLEGLPDVTIIVYPGATHSFDTTFRGRAIDFAGHHLVPDPAAARSSRQSLLVFFDRTLGRR